MEGISILVDFDLLYDKDYGLIRTMVNRYKDNKYLNTEYLGKVKFNDLIKDLINQEERDPLKLVFKDGINYKNIYDEISNNLSFIQAILNNSHPTKIINFMKEILVLDDNNKITVYCDNHFEQQKIDRLGLPFSTIVISNSIIDASKYDSIYIKDNLDLINKFKNIIQKHIYIANYKYNLNKDRLSKDEMILLALENDINTINIY